MGIYGLTVWRLGVQNQGVSKVPPEGLGEGSVHAPLLGMWTASFLPSLCIVCLRCLCVHISPFYYARVLFYTRVSLVAQLVKNLPVNTGDVRDMDLIPGLGRSPGEGSGNPHSMLAWEISWTEKPARLQSVGLHRVGHD